MGRRGLFLMSRLYQRWHVYARSTSQQILCDRHWRRRGGYDSATYSGWGGDSVLGIMTIDAAQTVTIGAGGTGGASPTAGGDTGIGSLLVAKGGANALTPSPASGGTTPSGCVRIQGGRSGGYYTPGCTGGTLLHTPVEANVQCHYAAARRARRRVNQ